MIHPLKNFPQVNVFRVHHWWYIKASLITPHSDKSLNKRFIMNDKKKRYIAWVSVSFLLFILFFINVGSSRYGLFTSDIDHTFVYDILYDVFRGIGMRRNTASNTAYFLWFAFLTGGLYFAWRYRYKTAELLTKYLKKIHEKV